MTKRRHDYKVVSMVDVNQLLSFAKAEYQALEEQINEEKRVEKELKEFINLIEKESRHRIHYIGHEKRFGKHMVRFLLKDGGFIEVMVEKPLVLNGHFVTKKSAENFLNGFKKALHHQIPDHPVKQMVIDSIKIEDGVNAELIKFETHNLMHKIFLRKTVVLSLVAVFIFIIFEIIRESIKLFAFEHASLSSWVTVVPTAIVIALLFEPLKELADKVVEDFFH
jgi:hypothetical protein